MMGIAPGFTDAVNPIDIDLKLIKKVACHLLAEALSTLDGKLI